VTLFLQALRNVSPNHLGESDRRLKNIA